MTILKKLIFSPLLLISCTLLISNVASLLVSYDLIFSFSSNTFILIITIAAYFLLTSVLFVVFAALANDWKIILPVVIICSATPFLSLPSSLAMVFAVTILASMVIISLALEGTLKTYLDFKPGTILGPSIRNLSALLILSFCLVYFLSTSKMISEKGFEIPDSLIDTALTMTPQAKQNPQTEQTSLMPQQLTKEQIDLLKKNPDLLSQYGLDPSILDTLDLPDANIVSTVQNQGNDLIKKTVKNQFEQMIKPYVSFIPIILAVVLFLSFQSLVALINIFIYPLLLFIFYILETIGLIKFEKEMREVKKLVV